MDRCAICSKPAVQLFETGKDGLFACFKCQPLVPEVTMLVDAPTQEQNIKIEDDGTGLVCVYCNKTFAKNVQLQNHLRNHRAERRFVCTYCDKAFSQSNNLRAHLRIHTNERPYKCSECGKAFTQVTNLNNHVRLHTGEKPFVCTEPGCNKAYAQVTNLNQHKKRHMNGRPLENSYDCTVCGESFQQRNHMYLHRRSAHAELQPISRSNVAVHTCKLCDRTFNTEAKLLKHVNEHAHGVTVQSEKTSFKCVFESCGARFASPAEHTEHLLRAHQLRILSTSPTHQEPPRRGRPPKILKHESLALKDDFTFEVPIKTIHEPQYLPKLKVPNLFP